MFTVTENCILKAEVNSVCTGDTFFVALKGLTCKTRANISTKFVELDLCFNGLE